MAKRSQWFERYHPFRFRVWNGSEFTNECSVIMGMEGAEVIGLGCQTEKTVIQIATGCHDKDGREIYEGDYVMTDEGDWIGAVVFSDGHFWCLDEHGGYSWLVEWQKGMVVGNVFEGIDDALVEFETKRREGDEMGSGLKNWIDRKKQA